MAEGSSRESDADLSTVAGAGLRLDVLSDDAVRQIHQGSLEVLEQTGVLVEDDEPLDILADGGCTSIARRTWCAFRPEVVEEALASCPQRIFCAGRDPKHDIWEEAGGEVHFTNFDEGIKYIDPRTGEYRDPTKDDVAEVARLIDALPNIAVYESAIGPKDVPARRPRSTASRRRSRTPPSTAAARR